MLTSITPLGERGRGNRYGLTVAAYLTGSVLGGAVTGVVLGSLGAVTLAGLPVQARVALAAAVCLAAVAVDLLPGRRLGGWRRQVNEDWLTRYRGWVYGVGFGTQLGMAVLTIVTSAATWAFLAVVALAGSPALGVWAGALFGLVRALPVLALRRVHEPADLRRVAGGLERLERTGAKVTGWWLAATAALLVAGLVSSGGAA